jgi:hypothetical protein
MAQLGMGDVELESADFDAERLLLDARLWRVAHSYRLHSKAEARRRS